MNTLMAKALFKKTTLFATALVLAVSTLTAAVPFILSKTAAAAAPYNVTVAQKCENGLVSFDVTGTNPAGGQPAVWVKSSAVFKLSEAQLVQPGTTASLLIKTDVASVPASAVTIFTSATENGTYTWLNEPSAIANYGAFNCYDTVYVAQNGNDSNTGTTPAAPFATVQKALDTVNQNGTVRIADGSYYGTADIKKSGTKLIGTTNSRDTVKIYATPTSGQAGIFANGLNDVTIKNLGVYGDNFGSDGALIKLYNGSNARIENVVVKNTSGTGININSYSDVVVTGVYVAGYAKDGLSVVAQQTDTVNISDVITLSNSTFSAASPTAWSAVALYTTASGGNNENIKNVTLSNISTQYGQRGLYVEGKTGKTVTSPSSNKLVLQNFLAGDNTNEYINNEQSADVNAVGATINVGGGVVVPVSQMTQAQYDATLLKIKDRDNKSPAGNNYGRVQLIDIAAPTLTLKSTDGIALANEGITNKKDVIAEWTKPVGATSFTYESWTTNGSEWNQANPYVIKDLTGTSQPGAFVLGDGTYFVQVAAVDALGNKKESNTFAVTYDSVDPVISGVTNGATYRGTVNGIKIDDLNFDKLFINGEEVSTKNIGGSVYAPVNSLTADDTYELHATDKGGNDTLLLITFTIDNSVVVTINENDIDTTSANPIITGLLNYVADGNEPVANEEFVVTLDDVDYNVKTDENGLWTLAATNLKNGNHVVRFGDFKVASFTTTLPVVTPASGVPTTPIPLVQPEAGARVITPTIINPSTFAAVLGTTTDNASNKDGAAVEGTSTKNTLAVAANSDANRGMFLGLSWYWWLLIVAAVAATAWWIFGAIRNRQAEN